MRKQLRQLRGERSQQSIAELLQISRSFYSQLEVGTRNPSIRLAKKIGELFEVDWSFLFEEECCNLTHKGGGA